MARTERPRSLQPAVPNPYAFSRPMAEAPRKAVMDRVTSVVGTPGTFARMIVVLRSPIARASTAVAARCRGAGEPYCGASPQPIPAAVRMSPASATRPMTNQRLPRISVTDSRCDPQTTPTTNAAREIPGASVSSLPAPAAPKARNSTLPVCIAVKAGPRASRLAASTIPVTPVSTTISAGMCGGSSGEPAVRPASRFSSMTPDSDTPARVLRRRHAGGIGSEG